MAHGYALDGAFRDISDQVQDANPSGGACSTVGDMAKFAEAVVGHRLLTPAMTNTVLTGKVKSDRPGGPPVDTYAYGFSDVRINGVRIVGHDGGTPGYEGQLDIYPDLGVTVVVLANQDQAMRPVIGRSEDLLTRSA
jgi:CubicO group peptidase (beta-lactamase class C family)